MFHEYAADRRDRRLEGFHEERFPHLVRYTPAARDIEGFVAFADLPPGGEREAILEQVRFFADRGEPFEWKVYDFDRPADLRVLLEREGFVAGPMEAFMLLPLGGSPTPHPGVAATGIRLERVRTEEGIRHVVAVQEEVWQRDLSWLADTLWRSLSERPEEMSIHCAYSGSRPVGTGWTEFPDGSQFADLHGGAVLPEARGRGVYSLLFDQRRQEAWKRGYRYLTVDAAPMSRPILERKGFLHICDTYPMRLSAPSIGPEAPA
jgi:GNAT superfamily N-acetyltransferase